MAYLVAEAPYSEFHFIITCKCVDGIRLYSSENSNIKLASIEYYSGGIVTACIATTKDYHTLLISRVFLGLFEAAEAPSLMLFSSQWHTRSEQVTRFTAWFSGVAIAQILGTILSFAFQNIGPNHLAGWRIMFIVAGIISVLLGVAIVVILPDSPMAATLLTEPEKVALLLHVSENRTGVENRHFRAWQILELLLDPQIWLLV